MRSPRYELHVGPGESEGQNLPGRPLPHCIIRSTPIIVVLEEGRVREVVGLPPNTQVTVVDYDVEDEDEQYLAASPIDGQRCKLSKF